MRRTVPFALAALLSVGGAAGAQPAPKDEKAAAPKEPPKGLVKDAKPTPAAELTLTKALKAKVSVDSKEGRLGDVLKEFAAQVDMRADVVVMWSYGPGFPYSQKVSYACRDKPLEAALDELLTKAGGLGYVVVSHDGDRRDGWVLLTATGERGFDRGPASEEEEKTAAKQLDLAKKLIDGGKPASAKPLLTIITTKHANTKAAAEAKELLAKLGK